MAVRPSPVHATVDRALSADGLGDALADVQGLHVVARRIIEGLRAGSHRSRCAANRSTLPITDPTFGDDLRHLDWKVLGRSDRLVLKRYEAELDLGVHLVVDGSASMAYQGRRGQGTKYTYAAVLAASLAVLVERQQDRSGITVSRTITSSVTDHNAKVRLSGVLNADRAPTSSIN